jgi:hypothetical protein
MPLIYPESKLPAIARPFYQSAGYQTQNEFHKLLRQNHFQLAAFVSFMLLVISSKPPSGGLTTREMKQLNQPAISPYLFDCIRQRWS